MENILSWLSDTLGIMGSFFSFHEILLARLGVSVARIIAALLWAGVMLCTGSSKEKVRAFLLEAALADLRRKPKKK